MKNLIRCLMLFLFSISLNAQIERVEPPNWWIGFENIELQLLIKGDDIRYSKVYIDYQGVNIVNTHYLFVTAVITNSTKIGPHKMSFRIPNGKLTGELFVDILNRREGSAQRKGFSSVDFIYLLMPDRFRNGNPLNDNINDMEKSDRTKLGGRHGGDIEGVRLSLDYLQDLGVTGLWLNPVLENDMPDYSYHGYAMTDLYKVDARFGSNEDYKRLSSEAKQKGIGLIMDQVANHIGSHHLWMSDLPSGDWINQWEAFTQTNHMKVSRFDIHAAEVDRKQFTDGWFVETMPDLNQANPKLARYLIQNSIWWVEYLDLYGIRMDTWSYPNKEFLSNWTKAILEEYPQFNIVGEEWVSDAGLISYWQAGAKRQDDYQSYLPSVMDFPLQTAIVEGLQGEEGWRSSMTKIYESLANDYKYGDVNNIMIFPDNHDMSRIFTQLEENFDHWKMAIKFNFNYARIPQIYYGTEVLISDSSNPGDHGLIRTDFPGGWENDTSNGFDNQGLSEIQLEMKNFLMKLLNFRKKSNAIHKGKTIHFAPINGVYLIARTYKDEVLINIINKNESPVKLDLKRFDELKLNGFSFLNVVTKEIILWENEIKLSKKGSYILNLQKP